jgi:hypothetical protein
VEQPPPGVGSLQPPGHLTVEVASAEQGPLLGVFEGALVWFALAPRGQQPVSPMAGGMPALDVVEGGVQLLRVRVRMRLAAVQAAQAAHHTRGPWPHGEVAQRAVLGEEHGQSVGVHTSALWATRRWAL